MPDKEKDSKKRSLFQGWASFFGKEKDAKDASQYLATRYYNSSELENINTKDSRYTLVDHWAREFSEKARRAVQGNPDVVDKDMPLPDVTWQDGKFKSYVKGNVMVEPDEDTVRHLKELSSSYHVELPKELQKFINEQAMKSMCNTYWYDKANDNVLHVTGYNAYDFQTTSQERYNDRSGFTLVVETLDNLGERIETDHTVSSKEIAALSSEGKLKKMDDNDINRYHSMCDIARKAASHYHDVYSYVKDIDGDTPIKGARIKFSLDEGSNYQFQATGFRVFMDNRPGSPSSYIRLYSDEMKKNGYPVGININRNNAHKYEGQLAKLSDYLLSDVEDIRKEKPVFTKEQQAYIDNLIKELIDKETQKDAAANIDKPNQSSVVNDGNSKTKEESQAGESVQQSGENSLRNAPEDTVKTEKSAETVSSDKEDSGILEELEDDEYAAAISAEEEAENMDINAGMTAVKPSESKEPGRWHTPEMMEKEAYRAYSKLLIYRINLQEIYPELPWVSKETGIPRDLAGNQFDAKTSLMLAMHTEKEGYTLPVYLDEKTADQWFLSVRDDARSFPVVGKDGVRWMYNIDDTNFRELYPRKFEELSQQDDADKNRLENRAVSLGNLVNNGQWLSPVKYDGEKDLASYDWKNNEIHVGDPKNYDDDNDFYRDLTIGMAANTRRLYQNSGNFDDYIREDLISHLTSAMTSQSFRFNSTSPDISHFWKDKLKNDPDYTKNVLSSAEKSTGIIYQHYENVSRGYKFKESDNLDYRTLTPGGGDEDGNDIPDELENFAAEKKQGANEGEHEEQDEPYQMHRRR